MFRFQAGERVTLKDGREGTVTAGKFETGPGQLGTDPRSFELVEWTQVKFEDGSYVWVKAAELKGAK